MALANLYDRPYIEYMANKAALQHFARIGEGNARALEQRAVEYARLTPYERMALGLTLHQEQLGLQRAMLGDAPKRARTKAFSIKKLRDAAQKL